MIPIVGSLESDGDDPHSLVWANRINQRHMSGPVAKDRVEDLQFWRFLYVCAANGYLVHPVETGVGEDPPDRVLRFDGRELGVELTELTSGELRARLADARMVEQGLYDRLNANTERFEHLIGRIVTFTDGGGEGRIGRDEAIDNIATALEADKGALGEGVDYSGGFPESIPAAGMYGTISGLLVIVQAGDGSRPDVVDVSCHARLSVTHGEVHELFRTLVARKDKRGNNILLISTGAIDKAGYSNPLDSHLFHSLMREPRATIAMPEHLDAIFLFDHFTDNVVAVYRRAGVKLPFRLPDHPS